MNRADEREYWDLIWEKFRTGDRRAFETIYNEYVDALFAYGSKITIHRDLLEDAIQDLFLDVYSYGSRLRKPESLEFYLYKTLKRIIYRKLKEKFRFTHPEHLVEQFDLTFPLEEADLEKLEEHTGMLRKELKSLDVRKRELLFLKFNSGMTYNEIGKLLDLKPDTVKKQVSRVLKFLRGKLGESFLDLFVVCFRKY
ncbi:RNA polymerase sigma factor [Mariniphaga sediminis]|uniref:RNA polymerase sigma factor n=1 Tax=Mariniphaga sediminis TaxID=1628158 RepID=UPI0015598C4C|nr:sigma-70 family RNA polymerase sigma factor [Mariniphaga sediminis]